MSIKFVDVYIGLKENLTMVSMILASQRKNLSHNNIELQNYGNELLNDKQDQ